MIKPGEFHTIQDFAERLTLQFNNEIQTEHFGGSCTVSLEGVAVRFFPGGNDIPEMTDKGFNVVSFTRFKTLLRDLH